MRWQVLFHYFRLPIVGLLCLSLTLAGAAPVPAPSAAAGFVDIGGVLAPICAAPSESGRKAPAAPHDAGCGALCLAAEVSAALPPGSAYPLRPAPVGERRSPFAQEDARAGPNVWEARIRGPPGRTSGP